jgi:hypothetical protein
MGKQTHTHIQMGRINIFRLSVWNFCQSEKLNRSDRITISFDDDLIVSVVLFIQ